MSDNEPCVHAVFTANGRPLIHISKADFDAATFVEGPYWNTAGVPYRTTPNRQAWGVLEDGRFVWAWVRGERSKGKVT